MDPRGAHDARVYAATDSDFVESDSGAVSSPSETGTVDLCGTAGQAFSDDWIEISHDDGEPAFNIEATGWTFYDYELGDSLLYEAVAFELDHPAKIHGFQVVWDLAPGDETDELTAGLYADFGYNGFDFWQYDPLWEGSRCVGDHEAGEWLTYTVDEPIELDHPGLIYVAHLREGAGDQAWSLDDSYRDDADCGSWGECLSAVNLPEGEASLHFNGISSPIPYDYMVRLWVEYTDDVAPTDTLFQPSDALSPGSRMAWGDYDGDGWEDVFSSGPMLHRNNGDGTFRDQTKEAGLSGAPGSGGTWGDFDNDGCLDLVTFAESYTSGDVLWKNNCDGTFTDVTVAAGITDEQSYNYCDGDETYRHAPTTAAGWWDVDSDGFLDLYLANMICWANWTFYRDDVYRNNGDGTFSIWTGENGFTTNRYSGRGANPADYDGDGDVDLLVNNYTLHQNLLWQNNGDGTVSQVATAAGVAGNRDWVGASYYGHTIGAVWGDLDNDLDLDLVQANLAHPRFFDFSDKTQVLLNQGDGTFSDIQGDWTTPEGAAGLRYQETHSVPVLADFDQDGALDLAISAVYDGRPSDFYWGQGNGHFVLDNYHAGVTVRNGWGMTVVDYDHDGDMDLAASGVLYENTGAGLTAGHWLQIQAFGNVNSNWYAMGATVRIYSDDASWVRHVSGGNGQGCQDAPTVHFGLGDVSEIERIEVDFPGSETVSYLGPFSANQRIQLWEDGDVNSLDGGQ